jgi:ferredoxin--NADP+ reductase
MTHEKSLNPVRVSRAERLGSAFALTWRRDFEFTAGQLAEVALDDRGPSRLYSLFTGPREDEAGILFNIAEGGELTPSLARLAPGDTILLRGPSGSFPAFTGPGVWIANGTGVAPFLSMARAGLSAEKTLLHGARALEDFYFQDELEAVMGDRYLRCRSGAGSGGDYDHGEGIRAGRLTAVIESESWDPGTIYELCGSAPMVVEVRDLLIAKGIPHSKIVSEVYF